MSHLHSRHRDFTLIEPQVVIAIMADVMETHSESGDITNREFEWLQTIVEQAKKETGRLPLPKHGKS
ncbi:MAG: hypothetical protein KDA52_07055 [Planctomycetaceae bacterium]|nr:hypothetical protein [Planctomycetaceae bacterium]